MTTDPSTLPEHLEEARLRDVERLELLDTPPEERFDQLVRFARRILGVPMASLSLMDRDRQWFKSIQGLDLIEVPRQNTVCRTVIARAYEHPDDPALILPDAAADPPIPGHSRYRWRRRHPLLRRIPVVRSDRAPGRTFCIYDTEQRHLDADQLEAFTEIAAWAQRELERADELDRAAEIQRQLLPQPLGHPGVEIATLCLPAFVVGGDFYDHYRVRDGVVITVADVMGKGLGAAIVSSAVRSSLRGAARVLERFGDNACSVLDTGAA